MAIVCCYLDVAREYLVVARMLLWCSGRLLVLLLYVVTWMLLGSIWLLPECCYGVQGGC